jgi:hypothetical protein
VIVGGVLVVGGALANVAMNNAVDDRAEGIQGRCVTAELRGDGTVLTEVHAGGC